ncbi:MAG: S9 family peptidase, partial [Actinomycetes bacterium]
MSPSPTDATLAASEGRGAALPEATELSYPRQSARTQRYTRGAPRNLAVTGTGSQVLFVRSSSGTDPVGRLWALDVATGEERVLVDPVNLLSTGDEELS